MVRAPKEAERATEANQLPDQQPAGNGRAGVRHRQAGEPEGNGQVTADLVHGAVDERLEDVRAAAVDREVVQADVCP